MRIMQVNPNYNKKNNPTKVNSKALNINYKAMAGNNISFEALDPLSSKLLAATGSGLFKVIKAKMAANRVHELFNTGKIAEGAEMTAGLIHKIGRTISRIINFEALINSAAVKARGLSDANYENIDVKRKLIEACFQCKRRHSDYCLDYVNLPQEVRTLFRTLDYSVHGDFKELVFKRAIRDDLLVYDADSLLEGHRNETFKREAIGKMDALLERGRQNLEDELDAWKGKSQL